MKPRTMKIILEYEALPEEDYFVTLCETVEGALKPLTDAGRVKIAEMQDTPRENAGAIGARPMEVIGA